MAQAARHRRRPIGDHDGARGSRTLANFLMQLERIAWLVTVVVGLIAAAVFFYNGFRGYGLLAVLLSLAASVNLAPTKSE